MNTRNDSRIFALELLGLIVLILIVLAAPSIVNLLLSAF
jgi:hypothetical protein